MKMEVFGNNYVTVLDNSSKSVHTTRKGTWYCFQSLLLFCVNGKKDLKMQHADQSRFFFGEQILKPKWIFFF